MRLSAKNNLRKRDGFTLVELMVTIVLIGMVIGLAGTFFNLSFLSERKVEDEYDLQASVRQASELLNNTIRKATVTFTLVNTEFEGAKKSKWNYFGVEDGTEIVQYTYNEATGRHDRKVLIKARDGISYNLYFKQNVPNSKLIQFNLECIPNGDVAKKIVVETELNAMNSVAVDDGGSPSNPATAIAYRSDPAPRPEVVTTNEEVTIAIALVLDKSTSMKYALDGSDAVGGRASRGSIMKAQAVNLINNQFSTQNIWASVIPFSNSANNPLEMKDCRNSTQVSQLLNKVNSISITTNQGTNTGDGLRRAYYQLKNYNANPANSGKEIVNYIIILTDGNPTFRSGTTSSWWSASGTLTADGNCNEDYVWGSGQAIESNINTCMDYVDIIGSMIKNNSSFPIRTFVIGFSGLPDDVDRALEIANYCTGSGDSRKGTYYYAGSEIRLEETLRTITTTILAETWHIYGPR